MARGLMIHKKAEKYIKEGGARLPSELKKFGPLFKRLRKKYRDNPNQVWVEESWSFTKDWRLTRWDDWANCVVRLKMDCAEIEDENVILIYDWKTGKFRAANAEEYTEQLDLYALGALIQYPNATILPKLNYLDTGDSFSAAPYKPTDLEGLKKAWERKTAPMLNDTIFAPSPSFLCQWCHYRKEVSGPCEF